ncbi:hypothetical protein [Hyphomicrobium sp. ghe19]|uniref:hypothetical protein n=1 Tax=Hyphomicrobium sp. ghe19 TaxID=2682968 RepID=UPI001366D484|nr:hypothetical protein HYPP_02436 [Hyphomicrobium sp. ghe19]
MSKVEVRIATKVYGTSAFDLPEGRTLDDIESFYVKSGTTNVTWKDGNSEKFDTAFVYDPIDDTPPCDEDLRLVE